MIRASSCAADVLLPGGPGDGAHGHRGFGTGLRRADARDRCRALRRKGPASRVGTPPPTPMLQADVLHSAPHLCRRY